MAKKNTEWWEISHVDNEYRCISTWPLTTEHSEFANAIF